MRKPLLILILLVGVPRIAASENHPAGARAIALSNSFVSISDTWSTFQNQATLASFESISAGIFYESRFLVDELSLTAGTFVFPTKSGTFGLCFFQFGEGTFKEQKIGLSFSKRLSQKLNAGIQLEYFSQRFPENDGAKGFTTFECGITYKTTEHLTLGAHVFNPVQNGIKTTMGKQKMPATYRLGGHYQFSDLVIISAEAQKITNHSTVFKTGLEFSPLKNMAFRFGVSGIPVQYTAGLGYSFGKITTDIAFSYHGNLGFSPSVSIQFNL